MTDIAEARDIISQHQITQPVRVVPIAKELGLGVYSVQGWPDSLSGKLKCDTNSESGYSIYVNANHAPVRQRFTVAHEIAHYILHRDMINEEVVDDALYRSGLSNSIEASANKFAADILMPWHLINASINSGITTLTELAKQFDVSQTAMAIRLGIPNES